MQVMLAHWAFIALLPAVRSLYNSFLSHPNIYYPPLDFQVNHADPSDDEFYFLTPGNVESNIPFIFDSRGELIWAGAQASETNGDPMWLAWNLHPVILSGRLYLAYTAHDAPDVTSDRAEPLHGNPLYRNLLLDNSYAEVKSFDVLTNATVDVHELKVFDHGITIVQQFNMMRVLSKDQQRKTGMSRILDNIFQVSNLETGEVNFEWSALDHVAYEEKCIPFDQDDYFHMNSVDRDYDGHYIIGSRKTCTAYKINGTDGSILWRLGGHRSDFKMVDDYTLEHMHHIRIRKFQDLNFPSFINQTQLSEKTHLALSIFDNAYPGWGSPTAPCSSGIVVLLNLENMTGQIVERYEQPRSQYGPALGSFHFLSNGNRLISWGGLGSFSEFDKNGTLLLHADYSDGSEMRHSYRVYKDFWAGKPSSRPAVFSYSWTCSSPTRVYVSWNGATAVGKYRVFGSQHERGSFDLGAEADKNGFETRITLQQFMAFVVVEALDKQGAVLGRSVVTGTRVPMYPNLVFCDANRCPVSDGDYADWDASYECVKHESITVFESAQQKLLSR